MADFTIKNLKMATDKGKCVPELEHDYIPLPEEYPDIILTCSYLCAGEINKYLCMTVDGRVGMPDYKGIFRDKVRLIQGLSINGQKITEPKELLAYPSVDALNGIVLNTGMHLCSEYDIEAAEVKN